MTPLLIFLGIPPAVAVATQTAQIVASSTTSGLSSIRRNALDVKLGGMLSSPADSSAPCWASGSSRPPGGRTLDLVIVVSYVTLFTVVGSLMMKESIREFWSTRRGVARPRRQAGDHAPISAGP